MTWGAWGKKMTTKQMSAHIEHCVSKGLTTFDHADIYGDYTTEKEFGLALKESRVNRDAVQLISKCGIQLLSNHRGNKVKHYNYSKDYIISSVRQSAKNLNTDYLDLLLLHRPSPLLHVDDVIEAVHYLKQEGIVREFGVSNFSITQMKFLENHLNLVSNQVSCSLTNPEMMFNGVLDYGIIKGQTAMVWSPLGGYFKQNNSQIDRIAGLLKPMCLKYSVTEDQLLLAWLLKHPAKIHPVIGSTNPERINLAVNSLAVDLDIEDWFLMLEASTGKPVP
jgi:predicted oxidoreductase